MCLTPARVKGALKGCSRPEVARAGDLELAAGCEFGVESAKFMKQECSNRLQGKGPITLK